MKECLDWGQRMPQKSHQAIDLTRDLMGGGWGRHRWLLSRGGKTDSGRSGCHGTLRGYGVCTQGGNMSPLVKVEPGAESWKVGRDLDLEYGEFLVD